MAWLWIIVPLAVLASALVALRKVPLGLWLEARRGGVAVEMDLLATMRAQGRNPGHLVVPLLEAQAAGVAIDPAQAHEFLVAGGDLPAVVRALKLAARHDLGIPFADMARLQLEGADLPLEVRRRALVGKVGRTASDVSPVGKATFHGELYDVRSDGGFIPQDRKVRIERVDRDHVWVKEVEAGGKRRRGTWQKI